MNNMLSYFKKIGLSWPTHKGGMAPSLLLNFSLDVEIADVIPASRGYKKFGFFIIVLFCHQISFILFYLKLKNLMRYN